MREIMIGLALILVAPSALAQGNPDRSRLPLQEALAGHWYFKKYDKNEYFEVVVAHSPGSGSEQKTYGPVNMTWDAKGGKEASKGVIVSSFHTVDEKRNMVILTYKSVDGRYVYFNQYTFSPDRSTITEQSLDKNLKPQYLTGTIVYVDSTSISPYVK